MDANRPASKALALEPVDDLDDPIPEGEPPPPAPAEPSAEEKARRDLRITTADEFLAMAAKEYQAGRVDPPLWRRAEDQCGKDPSLVIAAYLRARATALQLQQKLEQRAQNQARLAASGRGAAAQEVEPEPPPEIEAGAGRIRSKYLAAGAVGVAAVVTVVWLIASPRESELARQSAVSAASAAVPAPGPSVPTARVGGEPAAVGGTDKADLRPPFEIRVQELKNGGNWNVLVLYASDWTRREPHNAAAWHELSVGYTKLRQLEDAFGAATKAAQLAPENSLHWRNLGQVNLALERLPEAAIAFDKALAMSSDDAEALCGAALVAQRQGRRSDAEAFANRVKSSDAVCHGVTDLAALP